MCFLDAKPLNRIEIEPSDVSKLQKLIRYHVYYLCLSILPHELNNALDLVKSLEFLFEGEVRGQTLNRDTKRFDPNAP